MRHGNAPPYIYSSTGGLQASFETDLVQACWRHWRILWTWSRWRKHHKLAEFGYRRRLVACTRQPRPEKYDTDDDESDVNKEIAHRRRCVFPRKRTVLRLRRMIVLVPSCGLLHVWPQRAEEMRREARYGWLDLHVRALQNWRRDGREVPDGPWSLIVSFLPSLSS